MKLKAKSIGIPDAARRLYKLMELLVKGNQK
jgi:hypothetical protein